MRTFLYVIGVLLVLAALTFFIMGIWANDARWIGTAFITAVGAGGAFCSAPEFPAYVPHNERCRGC